jgi:hypothetical protein
MGGVPGQVRSPRCARGHVLKFVLGDSGTDPEPRCQPPLSCLAQDVGQLDIPSLVSSRQHSTYFDVGAPLFPARATTGARYYGPDGNRDPIRPSYRRTEKGAGVSRLRFFVRRAHLLRTTCRGDQRASTAGRDCPGGMLLTGTSLVLPRVPKPLARRSAGADLWHFRTAEDVSGGEAGRVPGGIRPAPLAWKHILESALCMPWAGIGSVQIYLTDSAFYCKVDP